MHEALVIQHHVLTTQQLNEAVVITRSTPGPARACGGRGRSVISSRVAPARLPDGPRCRRPRCRLIIPLVHYIGRKLDNPRVKTILQTIVIASAGLLLAASIPLARDALTDWLTVLITVVTVVLLLVSKIDTLWIVLGAAALTLGVSSLGAASGARSLRNSPRMQLRARKVAPESASAELCQSERVSLRRAWR